MRKRSRIITHLAGLAIALGLFWSAIPASVSAHETRAIVGGKYQAVVGFLTEPAYQGQMNGLSLAVTTKADGKRVEGLEKSLKTQVLADGKTLDLTVQSRFGQTGSYAGYFQPTAAGQYRFRVYGTINGDQIDETFESGPGRFNDVESIARLQFPNQVPTVPGDVQAQLNAARSDATTARTIAIAGVAIGAIGLVVGGLALQRAQSGGARREGA